MSFIIIYVTHPDETSAIKIANQLINEKLIACSNTYPIKSSYWWQGEVQKDDEFVTILKTTDLLWNKVESRIIALHTYDVPCIIKMEVEANEAYEEWIRESVIS